MERRHEDVDDAKHDARNDHVMEMGDEEKAVVHLPIDGGHGQQHAGQATQNERHHEADGPQNQHGESDASTVHCE